MSQGRLQRFAGCRSGSVLVEMAFTLPFLLILFAGGFEVGRFALLQMKVSRAAVTMADLVSQNKDAISSDDILGFVSSIPYIGQPFSLSDANTQVIVTGVKADASNTPVVCWQVSEMGSLGNASSIGTRNHTATLPQNLTLVSGDTTIIAEVFYRYEPSIFSGFVNAHTISGSAIFRPRLATLDVLEPSGDTCH